jgi:RNA-directed DNA polymerase
MQCLERRISDRSMLKLIRMWLRSPVVEDDGRGGRKMTRPKAGSPQGGSISPLLSNIYLHEMDRAFHEPDGPRQFANARLVRFADDLVVMARWMGPRITGWLGEQLEGNLRLAINRKKTNTVRMKEQGAVLSFLGFSFRFDRDLKGQGWRYLNVFPSKKAVSTIREKVRKLTYSGYKKPLTKVVQEVHKALHDWAPYFNYGYPRKVFRDLNHFVRCRFRRFLRNRSQRVSRPLRKGESLYAGLQRYGLVYL